MGLLSTIGAASGRAFGLTRVGAAIRDAYFNLTTLLLPGNGTNGAQNNTFLDSSSNNFTITRNGNTTQGAFSPFSQTGWSNYFDGSGDFLTSSHPDMNATWTIETWIYRSSGGVNQCIAMMNNGGFSGVFIFINTSNYIEVNNGVNATSAFSNVTVPVNAWTHIAVVRSGGTTTGYINGAVAGSNTFTPSTVSAARIGQYHGGDNMFFTGYISNFRVVNGTAVYTSAFTPSTSPLTAVTNTSLLTCQSNRFIDNSTNAYAITVNGNPSVQAFSPFAPTAAYSAATVGGSGYFDGSGDYLTASGNAAFAFGTGDFTVAAWIYPTNAQTITVLSSNYNFSSGTGNWSLYFGVGSAQTLYFNSVSGNKASSTTTTIPLNAWTHVAYTRVGTTGRFFVNGAQLGTTISDSFNYGGGTGNLFVGQQSDGTGLMLGYMADVQVLKGTGYSTLPIPTAPATNIANTSLLLNFTNAGITDATAKNVLETVGNAQISTTQSKFGGSSMYFDGTGDYLQVGPSQLLNLGASDFTIEFWIYPTSFASTSYPMYSTTARAKSDVLAFEVSTGGVIVAYITASGGGAWSIVGAGNIGTLTLNAWNHVALVRNGSNFRGYVGGVQGGMTTSSASAVSSFDGFSIGSYVAAGFFTGYIDDLRISRYARYTAAFTPPTAAFALQ